MRLQRLQEIFGDALELEPDEVEGFLHRECGPDESLAREVRELLRADAEAQSDSVWQAVPVEMAPPDLTGQRIGSYRIAGLIGSGGMGTVYRANREDSGYQQTVAIKLIKRGMDTEAIIRRFRQERQILANLQHPSIARLLDGGSTTEGLPYLVMELIDGVPLNEYCSRNALSITARVKLFSAICSAVHFAHQNLVIHRDLKPGNILVTQDGVPKLLDFGIARILNSEESSNTATGEVGALSPAYASPEQVRGERITTASDVYSLGVIFYEMLTGQSPYGRERLSAAELMDAVCQRACEKPSSVNRALKGDLDNILLMALRKDRSRRYASVEQLLEDITRYLELRPVKARGDDLSYVASRFIRRNWLATVGAALITLTLVLGIITTSRARARAERRFNDVRQLAHSFVFDYADAIQNLPGATPVRQRLVKEALRYLDSLEREANSIQLERELVEAYVKISLVQGNEYEPNLGDLPGAVDSVKKAIAIGDQLVRYDRSPETLDALASAYLDQAELWHTGGQLEAAEHSYLRAQEFSEAALNLKPSDLDLTSRLIRIKLHLGDLNGADGNPNLGRSARAAELYQQALVIGESLLERNPRSARTQRILYNTYLAMAGLNSTLGHSEAAVTGVRKALAMIETLSKNDPNNVEDRTEIAGTSIRLGRELVGVSKPQQAMPYFREAEATVEALCKIDPRNALFKRDLSVTEVHIGTALMKAGKPRVAVGYFRKASAISTLLRASDPGTADNLSDLALAERKMGQALCEMREYGSAELHAQRSLRMLNTLAAKSHDANAATALARTNSLIGDINLRAKRVSAAMPYLEKASGILSGLAKADPANSVVRRELVLNEAKLLHCRSIMDSSR